MTITGHQGHVTEAIYSPDGTKIATGGRDQQVKLWEAKSGKKYELKGRIQLQERRGLVDFLNGDVKLKWKEKKEKRQDSYDSLIEGE